MPGLRVAIAALALASYALEGIAVAAIMGSAAAGGIFFLSVSMWLFGIPIFLGIGHFPWWAYYVAILDWIVGTIVVFVVVAAEID